MPPRPETIEALNPHAGPTRVNKAKYKAVRRAMLKAVPNTKSGIAFRDLPSAVTDRLPDGRIPGGGSIKWYTTVVKLDLEARGLIERIDGAKPQRVRRIR